MKIVMNEITIKLNRLIDEYLLTDEELLIGLRVNLKKPALRVGLSTHKKTNDLSGLLIGADNLKSEQTKEDSNQIVLAQQMVFGLCNKRILVWARSAFTGRTKRIIGQIRLLDINGVTFLPGKFADRLTLQLGNDKFLELESIKIDKGEEFANQLIALLNNREKVG